MDLRRIRTRGKTGAGSSWLVKRLRSLLWRLLIPYVEGIGADIDRDLEAMRASTDRRLRDLDADFDRRLQATGDGIERRLEIALNTMRAAVASDPRLEGELVSVRAEAGAAASQLAAARKDAMAVAYRLASLEDELAGGRDRLILAGTSSGARFLVRRHDLIGRLVADGEEWEPHVRAAIESAARRDGVAVDAGAYIGLHTVTMSRRFRSVVAFEPQRRIYQTLCDNLALNGCTNVTAHNLALYDRAGPMRLSPPARQQVSLPMVDGGPDYARIGNAAALTYEIAEDGGGDVQAVALDELALESVALIKVDTQGADLRVLRGAEDTIRRCRPTVLFEWERELGAQHGAAIEDCHAFFAALDYDVAVLQVTSPGRQADYVARPR
jgi:FkbM family methyltransferase